MLIKFIRDKYEAKFQCIDLKSLKWEKQYLPKPGKLGLSSEIVIAEGYDGWKHD